MYWIDYVVVFIPLIVMIGISLMSRKYVRSVADFLAASRVAGRYVIAVAGGEASMGLISVIAVLEMYYASGFGFQFWSKLTMPLGLFLSLTGFCTYRFRETRAMTVGQFFEMRYNRPFRITAACIQSFSGILNYAVFPAVGARFLLYYLDLPIYLNIFGWECPTFGLLLLLCIGTAATIACLGGQITIMVSDCVQGIISYPLYAILIIYFFYKFSWDRDMLPTLLDRPAGKSFINPYDIGQLRDFNLFYVTAGIIGTFFNRMSWAGTQGYSAAARNAHEQKMGGLLGTWRGGFSGMMVVMIAVVVYTYMNNPKFEPGRNGANAVNYQLADKTLSDVAGKPEYKNIREEVAKKLETAAPRYDLTTGQAVESSANKTDDNYKRVTKEALTEVNPKLAQQFETIHTQMRCTLTMRELLPIGITGIFAVLMIFLMISTDNTYMHSWGSILIQDLIMPFRGNKPLQPKTQLLLLRCGIIFVGTFAFIFSMFFAQMDYILMFFEITGAIWVGGGTVITLGLYWRKGTSAGAFACLCGGASLAIFGMFCQKFWPDVIYPWLAETGRLEGFTNFLTSVSKPFMPYIDWSVVTPTKFPINSKEISVFSLLCSIFLYTGVSLLTCRRPYNLERMLHRGKYADDGMGQPVEKINVVKFFKGLIGITSEYTRGDKILAWSVFIWSLIYGFGLSFIVPVVWNCFYKWPKEWWATYFWITSIFMACLVGVVSTVWFTIGGIVDLRRLFRDLKNKKDNDLDNGMVIGGVSAVDFARDKAIDEASGEPETR